MKELHQHFIENPNEKWKLPEGEQKIDIIGSLGSVLGDKNPDPDKVKQFLTNPNLLRQLIIDRQEKGKGLILFKKGFESLLQEKFGPEVDIYSVSGKEVFDWIEEYELPEFILDHFLEVAYHLKDNNQFFRLLNIIVENQDRLKDKSVLTRAKHSLASWEATAMGNQEKALEINKSILGEAKGSGDIILATKIALGGTYNNKKLREKEKISDYENFSKVFFDNGNIQDGIQAMNEAAATYLNLAKKQTSRQDSERKSDNLEKALSLTEGALEKACEINHSNAIVKAHRILSAIYTEIGMKKEAEEHFREANKAKRESGYRY